MYLIFYFFNYESNLVEHITQEFNDKMSAINELTLIKNEHSAFVLYRNLFFLLVSSIRSYI